MSVFLYRLGVQNAFLKDGNAFGANAVLGTIDNWDLVLSAGNAPAMRLKPGGGASPNVVGGHAGNAVVAFFDGQTVGGGGRDGSNCWNPITFAFTRDCNNVVNKDWATIGGGIANGGNGEASTVGGGSSNIAQADNSTVSGGFNNVASGIDSLVAGGENNRAGGIASVVSGGLSNTASLGYATVGGGEANFATGGYAVVSGGGQGLASGLYSAVPGGWSNSAQGSYSFAAGRDATAAHDGSFVWNAFPGPASSFGNDRFHVFAPQGFAVDFGSQRPDGGGTKWVAIGNSAYTGYWYAPLSPSSYANGAPGVSYPATIVTWTGAALLDEGYWVHKSDANSKTAFARVDHRRVLDRLLAMPVRTWRYKTEPERIRHIGPTAQDFMTAFEVGISDTTISDVDAAGVALAGIQGLHHKLVDELQRRDAEIASLRARLIAIEAALERFVAGAEGSRWSARVDSSPRPQTSTAARSGR